MRVVFYFIAIIIAYGIFLAGISACFSFIRDTSFIREYILCSLGGVLWLAVRSVWCDAVELSK